MRQQRNPFNVAIAILLAGSIVLAGCGSTTVIRSVPSGAKLYMDGEYVGTTPYDHYDTKIVGSKTQLRLKLEGYENYHATLSRSEEVDVGAAVASFLVFPIPLLWIMKYKPVHTYELVPTNGEVVEDVIIAPEQNLAPAGASTADDKVLNDDKIMRLRQLKQMLDVKILTQAEFDAQKQRLLDNHPKTLTDADVVKLRKLKQLVDTSALTESEFETQKQLILNK